MRDATDGPESDGSAPDAEALTWDMEAEVVCPYCGEAVTIGLDPGGGPVQSYVEDCQVCCRPWQVYLHYEANGEATVQLDVV